MEMPTSFLHADDFSNNLESHLNDTALDALAEDLGSLLGGGSFHQGKSLGFPVGLDVGFHVPIVEIDQNNKVLKDDESFAFAKWGQVELGVHRKCDVIGRVGNFHDADIYGGGLRYGIIRSSHRNRPALSVSVLYNLLDRSLLEAETVSTNAVVSVDLPFVHPYLGVGYDWSELKVTMVSPSRKGKAEGWRIESGINISVVPFSYLSLGIGLTNDKEMYHGGIGIKI